MLPACSQHSQVVKVFCVLIATAQLKVLVKGEGGAKWSDGQNRATVLDIYQLFTLSFTRGANLQVQRVLSKYFVKPLE